MDKPQDKTRSHFATDAAVYLRGKIVEAAVAANEPVVMPEIAIVLGSGLGSLIDKIADPLVIPYTDVPHMRPTTQRLHAGNFVIGELGGKRVIALQGRLHFYEGYSSRIVAFPIFIMHMLGVKTVIMTNAVGGINLEYSVGDIVAVSDHINFIGVNPLRGDIEGGRPAFFPDMTDTYTPRLRELAREQAKECGIDLREGVYIGVAGPSLETPAEIRAFRVLGADLVGMSTVIEAIVARDCHMDILALSLVTNMAAGVLDEPISGDEIVATAKRRSADLGNLIERVIANL